MPKLNTAERVDLAAIDAAETVRHHPLVRLLGWASEIADQPQLYTICWATIAAGTIRGDARLRRTGTRMLAAEWLATRAKSFVKHRIDRTRPHVTVDEGLYRMAPGDSHQHDLSSFPSGHTAGAVAVAVAFASEYPRHRAAACLAAAAIAAIQVPRCKHYPTDVGVGAIIGLIAGGLVVKAD